LHQAGALVLLTASLYLFYLLGSVDKSIVLSD